MRHQLSFADSEYQHSDEEFIFADAVYRGAEKWDELQDIYVDWHIAERPGKVRAWKKHPRINNIMINIEYMKASVRAKVEHPFRIIKCQFGFTKACCRGLAKNCPCYLLLRTSS